MEEKGKKAGETKQSQRKNFVVLNGKKVILDGEARSMEIKQEARSGKFRFGIITICLVAAILIISIVVNARLDEEVAEGITRRENLLVHNGMTEEEVRNWAMETYGDGNYAIEVIPYENSLVTDHTGGREWYNGLDPGVKELVLNNGDTIIVVGPKWMHHSQELIDDAKKDHGKSEETEIDTPTVIEESHSETPAPEPTPIPPTLPEPEPRYSGDQTPIPEPVPESLQSQYDKNPTPEPAPGSSTQYDKDPVPKPGPELEAPDPVPEPLETPRPDLELGSPNSQYVFRGLKS